MKLRTKTLLIVSACLVSGFLAMALVSRFIFLERFRVIEEQRMARNVSRAVDAFQENIEDLGRICQDWSVWNEVQETAISGDPSALRESVGADAFRRLNVNFVAIASPTGHVIVMRAYDEESRAVVAPPRDLADLFTPRAPDFLAAGLSEARQGTLVSGEGPFILAARPIAGPGVPPAPAGTLILGRYVQTPEIKHLARITHLELSLSPVGRHPLDTEFRRSEPVPGEPHVRVSGLGQDALVGFATINDIAGKPCLLLSVSMPRDVYEQGKTTVWVFLIALAFVGVTTVVVLSLLLDRLLLARLKDLSRKISALAPDAVGSATPSPGGPDEVSLVETAARRTFDVLTKTQEALRSSQENLEAQVAERTRDLERANAELLVNMAERDRAADSLRQSEERFRGTLDAMLEGCQIIDFDFRYAYVNESVTRHGKRTKEELLGRPMREVYPGIEETAVFKALQRCMTDRLPHRMENLFYYGDGTSAWFDLSLLPVPEGVFILSYDITERKQLESEREITTRLLSLLNSTRGLPELVRGVSLLLSAWLGCDAIAIRLREGERYPYSETRGFHPGFIHDEESLQLRDDSGEAARGAPRLEPLYARVLQGRGDGDKPCFTDRRSFWTNSATDLLDGATGDLAATRTLKRCQQEGYESVAMVALRAGEYTCGILQVCDKRAGRFTSQRITLLEHLADHAANAIAHRLGEEELLRSEERYRQLAESMNEGLLRVDHDDVILYANPRICEMLGYREEELLGRVGYELVVFEEDRPLIREKDALRRSGVSDRYESRMRKNTGEVLWVEISGSPIRGPDGAIIGSIGLVSDITERKRTEEALRSSEERYRHLVEISPDAIFIHYDGKIVFANPAGLRLLGASSGEQLFGKSILDAVHPEYHDVVKARVKQQVEEGQRAPLIEEKFIRLDGSEVDVEVSGVPMIFQGHRAVQVIVRDITERKRLEATRAAAYQISEAAISCPHLKDLYAAIHAIVGRLMDARNFYIALYEPEGDLFAYPYWVDEYDPQPEPEKPSKSLTTYVFRTGKPLLASPEVFEDLVRRGEVETFGAPSIDWLGVPLKVQEKTIGVLVVQSYREGVRYGGEDLEILSFVSSQVALAIDRKRGEEALRGSEERYRALVENQGEGVTYLTPDQTITFANPAAEDIFGVPAGELIGRNVFEFTSPAFMAETVAQAELRKRGAKSTYETEITRPDGEHRSLLLTAVPVYDKSGAYAGNLGVFFDITGRRKTETERQLLATAIEQSSDGILVTDPEGTILYVNRAIEELTGFSRLELLGANPRLLRSGEQDQAFYQGFWKSIMSGRVWNGRFVNRRKDGTLYTSETTVSPVTDANGSLTAFVCSQRDVTRELQWEEELQRARRLETVGLLAGVVAHEVRNPLFAISTLCAALEKNLADLDQFKPFTSRIQEQVKKLGRLMSDLLMLGRPLDLARFVPCDIREVIVEATRGLEETGECAAGRFLIGVPDSVPDAFGLPDRLVQVFQNLALNALHHSPPDEPIRIAVTVLQTELLVTVTDAGPGLPQDLGLRVFEPFQSRRSGGTGLGLAVVRQIAEAHGGRVSAEDNAEGPGATFSVWLPLSKQGGGPG